ncbi:hypothetical protein [Pedobacter insulae]|uniref:Uncharacterized protein n=1 Tax=Pedobacter insulae TaxID=414048 RepID=A0A1I2Z5Y0_9SPHI|nr:hypothetical protein [Pedobacter insulae]SFH33184.1 hypothetical protein SAMN04489864_10914 [Pedobacter insulae]
MMKYLVENRFPEGILGAVLSAFERSKDVFPSTETSLPAPAGNEGAAELAPSGNKKRST